MKQWQVSYFLSTRSDGQVQDVEIGHVTREVTIIEQKLCNVQKVAKEQWIVAIMRMGHYGNSIEMVTGTSGWHLGEDEQL